MAADPDPLAPFAGRFFVVLETYRRNGLAVRTALWFVAHAGKLYMRTPVNAAKVRRLRHNARVRVAPSDLRGRLRGAWLAGEARLIPAAEAPWVNRLVIRKYGLAKRLLDLRARLWRIEYVVIEVSVMAG